jgi:hypothetical protein
MTATATLLVLLLPFLLSLAGRATMPRMLCLVTSLLALLLSVKSYAAVVPWLVGMIIAVIAVYERFGRCRAVRIKNAAGLLPPRSNS